MDLIKRIAAYFIVFAMVIGLPVFMGALPESMQGNGSRVYASGTLSNLDVQFTGDISGVQGDKVTVAFTVKNTGDAAYTVEGAEAVFNSKDITVTNGGNAQTILASKGDSAILSFNASIAKNAETGSFNCFLKTKNGESANFQFTVSENLATPDSNKGNYVGSADISHTVTPSSGFAAGDGNKISFDIHNNGNTIIKNAKATVTLPENISVYNSSNSVDLGYISTGQRKNATFEISVADTIESKNYPITLSITGLSYSNTEVKIEKTFYVPVAGGGATSSTKNMSILNISVPGTVTADKDFNMSFSVKNTGTTTAKNLKVFVEMPEGLLNKTTTTFVENSIAAGETKTYSVTMFSSVGGKTYPIKIAVDPLSGTGGNTLQYVSVYVEGGIGTAKTPQLMIDSYSYGGNSVKAGKDCNLNVGLYNTSGKTITNVKVSLASEDGTFVPFGSSNSFFVERIPAKGHYTKNVDLRVKPAAEQKTSAITVTMAYEDGAGGAYTATDIISIPVTQESRLVVDDIVPPYEVYVGQQGACEVSFYNMGKSVLSNLRVNAEGNFDVMQSNSYYAGNMDSGKSDSYSFTFVPREVGPMEGKLLFTYEDANGEPQNYEVAFTFQAMEMPVMEDPGMMQEEEKAKPWGLIIGGGIIVLLAVGVTIFLKIRKRKLHKSLELADEAFMADMDITEDAEVEVPTEEIKSAEAEETKGSEKNGFETKASEIGENNK